MHILVERSFTASEIEMHFYLIVLCEIEIFPSISRIKISVNTDISVIGFYANIKNIDKILVDFFIKISVRLKIFIFQLYK